MREGRDDCRRDDDNTHSRDGWITWPQASALEPPWVRMNVMDDQGTPRVFVLPQRGSGFKPQLRCRYR